MRSPAWSSVWLAKKKVHDWRWYERQSCTFLFYIFLCLEIRPPILERRVQIFPRCFNGARRKLHDWRSIWSANRAGFFFVFFPWNWTTNRWTYGRQSVALFDWPKKKVHDWRSYERQSCTFFFVFSSFKLDLQSFNVRSPNFRAVVTEKEQRCTIGALSSANRTPFFRTNPTTTADGWSV